jgi:hypothetical protein
MKSIVCAAAVLAGLPIVAAALTAGPARAHDLRGIVAEQGTVEPEVWKRIAEARTLRRLLAGEASKSQDGELEAVIVASAVWPDSRVSACFLDGGTAARRHVAQVAQRWVETTGLQLDFGPAESPRTCDAAAPSNIRVSFAGSGHWSMLGTEAKSVAAGKPTLNLSGMNKASFSEADDGIILHEFGHAIGFDHEHQSPASVCEQEFDWDYLYVAMGGWGWSRQTIDVNMRQLPPSTKMAALTGFDKESVMLYDLEREYFKREIAKPVCFIPRANNAISRLDREAAATVYPVAVSSAPPAARAAPAARSARARDEAVTKAIDRLKELSSSR